MEPLIQIYHENDDTELCFVGSGFFISPNIVRTVGHNFKTPGKYLGYFDESFHELFVANSECDKIGNTKLDLAICVFSSDSVNSENYYELASSIPPTHEDCKIIGFSADDLEGNICYSPANIERHETSCKMHFEGINEAEFNLEFFGEKPKPGMSGGAILSSNGKCIGALIGPKLYKSTTNGAIGGSDNYSIMGTSFKRILDFKSRHESK